MKKFFRTLLSWLHTQPDSVAASDRLPVAASAIAGDVPASLPTDAVGVDAEKTDAAAADAEGHRKSDEMGLGALYGYLAQAYRFRFNLLTDRTEVAAVTGEALAYRVVDKRTLNDIAIDAMARGFRCWDRDVRRWVESGHIEGYHPFGAYFAGLPAWDGEDRVVPLARRVSTDALWQTVFHRWLLALTATWMGGERRAANSIAPILISTEQGWGKSTFARRLMPTALLPYFTEAFDLGAPTACVRQLAIFGLINLDEFDRIAPRKMPLLKTLMQMEELRVRRVYKPQEEAQERLASFIATSNRRDLLTDGTGSRRFMCIELERPIPREPICHDQLYAQLRQEVERGERWWLSKGEEADMQRHNRAYYVRQPVEEAFDATFEVAREEGDGVRLLSAVEVYAVLRQRQPDAMRGVDPSAFARQLSQWALRVHTKYGNGYWLRERT